MNLSFPKLKYNKKIVFSWINDDSYTIWNTIFCPVNQKYVSNARGTNPWNSSMTDWEFFVHDGMKRGVYGSTGSIPTKPLEYSDGCGVKHRFASSIAIWPDKLFTTDHPDDSDYIMGPTWLWTGAREAKKLADFGYSLIWHDVFNEGDTENQATFDQRITEKTAIFQKAYGKTPKSMAEPNGNHSYIDYCQNNSLFQYITAQSGDPRIQTVYPFKTDFSLSKDDVTVQRIFFSGTHETYINDLISRLQTAHDATDLTTIPWVIGSGHRSSKELDTTLFTRIEELFGSSGDDSIWVPSVDEFYEYWYMTKGTKVTKTINGQVVNFKLEIPVKDNFWFKTLSCLVDGLPDASGVNTPNTTDCDTFSYGISDGKVLINFGWSGETYTIANKYLDKAMYTFNSEDYLDAKYFSQLLTPDAKQNNENTLSQTWPEGYKLVLNEDYSTTIEGIYDYAPGFTQEVFSPNIICQIYLENSMEYNWYMISEDPNFNSSEWLPGTSSDDLPYYLNGGSSGEHTLYFKVKDDIGTESNTVSRKVNLNIPDLLFTRIYFSPTSTVYSETGNGATIRVRLDYKSVSEGGAELDSYRIAEGTSSTDTAILETTEWIKFEGLQKEVSFSLSDGTGQKFVLAQVKDIYGRISEVRTNTATVEYPLQVTKFMVNKVEDATVTTYSKALKFDAEGNYPVDGFYISYLSDHSDKKQIKDPDKYTNFILPDTGTEFTIYPQAYRGLQIVDLPTRTIIFEEMPLNTKVVFANVNTDIKQKQVENIGTVNSQGLRTVVKNDWIYDTTGKLSAIQCGSYVNDSNLNKELVKFNTKWGKTCYLANSQHWNVPTLTTEGTEYPNELITNNGNKNVAYFVTDGLNAVERRLSGVFLRNFPTGSYKVRILLSHDFLEKDFTILGDTYTTKGAHYYQVQDQIINPVDVSIYNSNNTEWLTFDSVTVDDDGLFMVGYYIQSDINRPSAKLTVSSPICLIEITKIG